METFRDRVTVTSEDGVAHVRLARADKLNALDAAMMHALADAAAWVAQALGVRAVVLSGEGEAFCAGLDLAYAPELLAPERAGDLSLRSHGDANLFQHIALAWRDLPVPVIAALHGSVFGGGLQIALGADIRIAAPGARLSIMEMRWAVIPDMALAVTLAGQVRPDVLRDLIYTARIVPAAEACALGLVTRLADNPLAAAREAARAIAARSPAAVRAAKQLVELAVASGSRAEALQWESDTQAALIRAGGHLEAFRAHAEKRAPAFPD